MTILTILKNMRDTKKIWDSTFARWQETCSTNSLDYLRIIRANGFLLSFKTIQMNCWCATILNQVVDLNGKTFQKNPRIKCFHEDLNFDIILTKESPYYIERIDVDIIDKLGSCDKAQQYLNDMVEISDTIGCPLRMTDHAELRSMVPCSLIALLNNSRARTFPQTNGFKSASSYPLTKKIREHIALFRFQHQNQLIHFINGRGKINKDSIKSLCKFLKEKLPKKINDSVIKLSQSEYIRCPRELKQTTLNDLM